jgi:hypothetical protein
MNLTKRDDLHKEGITERASQVISVFERTLGSATTLVTAPSITLELEARLARGGRVGQGSCRRGI